MLAPFVFMRLLHNVKCKKWSMWRLSTMSMLVMLLMYVVITIWFNRSICVSKFFKCLKLLNDICHKMIHLLLQYTIHAIVKTIPCRTFGSIILTNLGHISGDSALNIFGYPKACILTILHNLGERDFQKCIKWRWVGWGLFMEL